MRRLALLLLAALPTAAVAQSPAAKPRVAPEQVARQVRDYRMKNEDRIVRELAEFLAIPNVASDTVNIQKNATHLVEMLEARGNRNAFAGDLRARAGGLRQADDPGSQAHGDFLRALRRAAGRRGGVDRWQAVRAGAAYGFDRGGRQATSPFRRTASRDRRSTKTIGESMGARRPTTSRRSWRCWRRSMHCARRRFRWA